MFTEEDAKNDGLIKREVGREMAKVAQTQNPEVYEHFVRVCEEVGREPQDVFGEMAVRSLDSDEYAERVLGSELSMKQLRADEIRLEDVQYVKRLSEELGLNEEQESNDPIDKLIDERLQSITRSPVPRLNRDNGGGDSGNKEMARYMEQMSHRLEEMEEKLSDREKEEAARDTQKDSGEKSTDELFTEVGSGDDGSDAGEVVEIKEEPKEPGDDSKPSFGDIKGGEVKEHDNEDGESESDGTAFSSTEAEEE